MRVLAVDPGLNVGWATQYEDGCRASFQGHKWEFLKEFDPATWSTWFDVVVCERYTITPQTLKMSRQPHPIEVIGVLRYWCESTETTFVEQTPAEAKSFVTNERLRKMELYPSGQDHAADAMRHLVLYLVKERIIPASELV